MVGLMAGGCIMTGLVCIWVAVITPLAAGFGASVLGKVRCALFGVGI
jgi:hypothetical protein